MPRPSAPSSPGDPRRAGEEPDRATVREFVSDALAGTARALVISLPAPVIPPNQLLRALPEPEAVSWHPPDGAAVAGIGTAAQITVSGPRRCEQLALVVEELFSDLKVRAYPGFEAPPPRLFGGLAFAPGLDGGSSSRREASETTPRREASETTPRREASETMPRREASETMSKGEAGADLWQGFGDGHFVLPRWCYAVRGERACLSLAIAGAAGRRRQALIELDTLWQAFERSPAGESVAPATAGTRLEHLDPKIWNQRIKQIRGLIAAGKFQKVVTARTTTVESEQPFDALGMIDRLEALYPRCTRFLFRRGEATFIGATPETLFAKRGTEIVTHALAGSVKVHPDLTAEEAGAALLKSGKNREEHAVVARQVLEALEPLAEEVEHAGEPRVMQLQNLLHLETPIRARLRPSSDVAALLAALHPTPAVAGLPRAAAVRWIAANEASRGWYTGPVGWLDAAGDGEFAVAIRCALLERRRAHVFAGAGIMHDSDPPMEYGETAVKLQAMLRALGVEA